MVIAALAATTLILFAALAIDVGIVWSSRTQSQGAGDAAALAAALNMIDGTYTLVTKPAAEQAAIDVAAANSTVGNPSVVVQQAGVELGYWDVNTETFDPTVNQSDPDLITGARVTVLMDDVSNSRSPTFLAGLLGIDGFDVKNTAIGYLGFEGSWDPAEFDLPIVIDSCDLVSDPDGCGNDFCQTIATPPNPCALTNPQAGDGNVTCLDFSPTTTQNACWTQFDDNSPSINTPGLKNIVDNGNPNNNQSGDRVYLDNGDKTNVQAHIKDAFEGTGPYAGRRRGNDRYAPFDGKSDSWVVKLPVVECQDTAHCAGGSTYAITGGVCFEIREVTGPPVRRIKGKFLCPDGSDANARSLWETYCQDNGNGNAPGGCNFGNRADRVVLVQ